MDAAFARRPHQRIPLSEIWMYWPFWFMSGAILVMLLLIWQQLTSDPPYAFSRDTYLPSPSVVCPGDTVSYPLQMTVTGTPARPVTVTLTRTWWDVTHHLTIIPDAHPLRYNWRETQTMQRRVVITVPLLPAGPYEYRVGAEMEGARSQMYAVPITIAQGCPHASTTN